MFIRISLSRSRELGIVVQSQHTLLVYRWLIPGFLLPWDDDDDDDYSFSSFWFVLIFVLAPVFFLIWFSLRLAVVRSTCLHARIAYSRYGTWYL